MVKSKKPNTKGSSNRTGSKNAPNMLVYEALATLNRDFEQTLRDLNQLEELCIFPHRWQRKFVKTWRATLEETRAWASFEILEVLHRIEEREWVRFGRIRHRSEKQTADGMVAPSESTQPKTRRSDSRRLASPGTRCR